MKSNIKWIIKIVIVAVAASSVFTFASSRALSGASYVLSFAVLAVFVLIGVAFDAVGVAVAAAREAPFHGMNSRKERGAKQALRLIRSAEKVSTICSDVVGDISGIVSGSTAALVAERLTRRYDAGELILTLIISGLVTALTIGGKAAGKMFALGKTNQILLNVGKAISVFEPREKKRQTK